MKILTHPLLSILSFAAFASTAVPSTTALAGSAPFGEHTRTIKVGAGSCQASGHTGNISGFADDNNGAVSFNIDVNGDTFGSTHDGTITCDNKFVRIVSEQLRDGGCSYNGNVNGGIYTWHTQCGSFAGVHYTVTLKY